MKTKGREDSRFFYVIDNKMRPFTRPLKEKRKVEKIVQEKEQLLPFILYPK